MVEWWFIIILILFLPTLIILIFNLLNKTLLDSIKMILVIYMLLLLIALVRINAELPGFKRFLFQISGCSILIWSFSTIIKKIKQIAIEKEELLKGLFDTNLEGGEENDILGI